MNLRLLQLASPSLPVGAYSYSQGLEAAIEAGVVTDGASAEAWIADVLELSLASMEAPALLRMISAWKAGDLDAVARWNDELVASRETAELRAETLQMGYSLRRLLVELGAATAGELAATATAGMPLAEASYPAMYAFAVARWAIEPREALEAYLFAWLENQMLAALKSVPLGQTEGQRMLLALADRVPAAVERAFSLGDGELANFAPGLALLSSRHETQYSRIFRS